jgi:hypothetical protein
MGRLLSREASSWFTPYLSVSVPVIYTLKINKLCKNGQNDTLHNEVKKTRSRLYDYPPPQLFCRLRQKKPSSQTDPRR